MTNLTEQEIVDAIDRALERVEQRFAASRAKASTSGEADHAGERVNEHKAQGSLVAPG
jgi:hypothetical protein